MNEFPFRRPQRPCLGANAGLRGWVLCLILSVSAVWGLPDTRLRVAVNDFEVNGLSASEGRILVDRLNSELLKTNVFVVVERADMESILREQGFQESGACNTSTCQVQIGQLLGVDRLIAGQIGRLGELVTLNVRVLHVGTGQILYTATQDTRGSLDEILQHSIADLAQKIAVQSRFGNVNASLDPVGDLYVESNPSGAVVELDDKAVQGVTPLTLRGIPNGLHRLSLRLDSLQGFEVVVVQPGDLLKVKLDLQSGLGSIKIFSEPLGAQVWVDGVLVGVSPVKLDSVRAGTHQLRLQKEGYMPDTSLVRVDMGGLATVNSTLQSAGQLQINVVPSKASVYFNDSPIAFSPGTFNFHAGLLRYRVAAPDYEPFEDSISIQIDTLQSRQVVLHDLFAALSVTSKPVGCKVFVDGYYKGVTPIRLKRLTGGSHRVELKLSGYDSLVQNRTLIVGRTDSLNVTLTHNVAALFVESTPAGAEVLLDQTLVGQTPFELGDVVPGSHRLGLQLEGWRDTSETMIFYRDSLTEWSVDMRQGPNLERQKILREKKVLRILGGVLMAGGSIVAAYYDHRVTHDNRAVEEAASSYDQANSTEAVAIAHTDYKNALDDSHHDSYKRSLGGLSVFLGLVSFGLSFAL